MQDTLIRGKYNPDGINKSNWKIDFDISSSPHGSSTLSLITNVSDNKAEGQPLLRRQNKSECSLIRGTKVMVLQSEFEQRETYKNSKCGNYNPVGCSEIGTLVGTLLRTDSRGSVEQSGSTIPHKYFRNESSQIGDRVVLQGEKTEISSPTNRQRHSPVLLGENGRNKERRTQKNFVGNLGVLNWEQNHTYCRIPHKLSKHSGGL